MHVHCSPIRPYICGGGVRSLSPTWLCDPMDYRMPGSPVLHRLLEFAQYSFTSIQSVMLSTHLILCPLLLLLLSNRVFPNEPALCINWPKYWSFSFSISPSNEYSGLISFRMNWFELLAVQETLKSLLQQHSSKASILQCSVFFMVQLSHDYWKNHSFHYPHLCWQSDVSAF